MATGRVGNIKSLGVTIEAAFGYDPDDTSPSWTDISDYVRSFATRRGRRREIDRVTAGQCTIQLDNMDRRFEAGYTGGTYGSNVVPMVPIRIRCTRNAVTYPVFYGFADEWVPSLDPQQPRDAVVTLRATDAFKVLAIQKLDRSVWEQEVLSDSPYLWFRMDEKLTDSTMVDQASGLNGFYEGKPRRAGGLVPFDDDDARDFGDAQYGQVNGVGTSGSMTVEMWVDLNGRDMGAQRAVMARQMSTAGDTWLLSHGGVDPDGLYIDYLFDHSRGGELMYINGAVYTASVNIPPGRHHIVCTASAAGAVGAADAANAFLIGRIGMGFDFLTYSFWLDGVVDEVVVYDAVLDATAVLDHYTAATQPRNQERTGARIAWLLDQAGWPAALRDLDTGESVLGPVMIDGRAALDLLWETVEFEAGNMFVARDGDLTFAARTAPYVDATSTASQATYSYTGSNSKFAGVTFDYSDERLVNHCRVTTRGGAVYESEDATSIGRYLRRTKDIAAPEATGNYGDALSQWIVQVQKDPKRRITSLRVPTMRDTTTFDQTVALELGYRVTVALDPPGTGTISEYVVVEGIDTDVTPDGWTTQLWCSPVPTVDIAIVGTSLVGGSQVLGY